MTTTNAATETKFQVKKPLGKRNGVSGVDMGRVDIAHLRDTLTSVCKLPDKQVADASPDHCCVLASSYFENHFGVNDQTQCTDCGGISGGLDVCPYCNDHDDRVATGKLAAPVIVDAVPANGGKDANAPRGASETKQEGAEDMMTKQATVKTTKNKAKAAEPAKQNGHANGAAKTNGTALAVVKPVSNAIVSCAVLDKQVSEVRRIATEVKHNYHALGGAIRVIHESKSWSLRLTADGKQVFRNFEAFCQAELDINPQHALKLVDVSNAYTPAQIAAYGISKADLMLRAPPEARPALEAKAAAGATKREIEAEVNKARAATGHTKPARDGVDRKPKAGGAATATKAAAKAQEKVTVANMLGSQTLKAYRKPTVGKKAVDAKALKESPRAKGLSEEPFSVYTLENGVQLEITTRKADDGLVVHHVRVIRVEE